MFSEGVSKEAHTCLEYAKGQFPDFKIAGVNVWNTLDPLNQLDTTFIPNWFDNTEFADDFSSYGEEFLRQHSGRAGTLVWVENGNYHTGCSGTLISDKYFITAGHCAEAANVGILFGYQLEDHDGNNNFTGKPRVALDGYLDNYGIFRNYGQSGSEYSSFMEHPAYFPINKSSQYSYNDDRAVERGWANVGWINKEQGIPQSAESLTWPIGNPSGTPLGKIDYAIYELGDNAVGNTPSDSMDPWPWTSQNNQLSPQTYPYYLIKFWDLPDNTNGFRGWARVNTRILNQNINVNMIGFPGVSNYGNHAGLEVVNGGSVVDGKGHGLSFSYEEDILIFKDADLMPGNSGSSVIDQSGYLSGVAVWTDCAPGGTAAWAQVMASILTDYEKLNRAAKNYATPMWKICRASKVVKNLARDQNCNGRLDWWDFILSIITIPENIKVGIGGNIIGDLDFSSSSSSIKNFRYDHNLKKVVIDNIVLPPDLYQSILPDDGDLFNIFKQNGIFNLSKNGSVLGQIFNYPEIFGSKSTLHNGDIYLAGGYFTGGGYDYFFNGNNNVQFIMKIEDNGQNGFDFFPVAEFPEYLEDVRIVSLDGDLYLTGNSVSNFSVYKLVSNSQNQYGYAFEAVNLSQPIRKDYNLTSSEGKIIVSGGATDYLDSVAELEMEQYPDSFGIFNNIIMISPSISNEWIFIAENINDMNLMMSVTTIENNNLLVMNPFVDVENSIQKVTINLSDIPINGGDISVSFDNLESKYCLGEESDTIFGGRELSGECTPFTEKEFNSIPMGTTVNTLAGLGSKLAIGTGNQVKIYDITNPLSPTLLYTKGIYGPASDMLIYGNKLIVAVENGIDTIDLNTYAYYHKSTYGSTKALRIYNGKLYAGDGQGIKVLNPDTLAVLQTKNTSGSVKKLEIMNGVIYTVEWSGLKRFNQETLAAITTNSYSISNPELKAYNGNLYASKNGTIVKLTFNSNAVVTANLIGDKVDLRNNYSTGYLTYFPNGSNLRVSTMEEMVSAVCGNGTTETGEICDGNSVECTTLSSDYVSGTAVCNSSCNGYDEANCEEDGW